MAEEGDFFVRKRETGGLYFSFQLAFAAILGLYFVASGHFVRRLLVLASPYFPFIQREEKGKKKVCFVLN